MVAERAGARHAVAVNSATSGLHIACLAARIGTGKEIVTSSGLKYVDQVVGAGDVAKAGQTVSVHYTGWLTDGTKFDSSVDRDERLDYLRLEADEIGRAHV